jgi:hypothetical protein
MATEKARQICLGLAPAYTPTPSLMLTVWVTLIRSLKKANKTPSSHWMCSVAKEIENHTNWLHNSFCHNDSSDVLSLNVSTFPI